jgi:hypothetical protein
MHECIVASEHDVYTHCTCARIKHAKQRSSLATFARIDRWRLDTCGEVHCAAEVRMSFAARKITSSASFVEKRLTLGILLIVSS